MRESERDRREVRLAPLVLVTLVVALAALPLLSSLSGEPVSLFTRDVFSIAEIPVYAGLYSNMGIFLWGVTCAIALFTAWTAGERSSWSRERVALAGFGVFSGILMADDFFMVHEWIAPEFLGVPETVVVGFYGILVMALLFRFRGALLAHEPGWLGVALAAFAASTGMDVIERPPAPAWHYLAEESLKLIGIGAWFAFFAGMAADVVRGTAGEARR